jgi:hypothetical protein
MTAETLPADTDEALMRASDAATVDMNGHAAGAKRRS